MKGKTSNINFWQFFQRRIAVIEEEGRWGTAINYEKALRSFRKYCGGVTLRFRDITPGLIAGYNNHLYERGLIRNSVSQYNRVLRAVYNEAVRQGLGVDLNPFKGVYTGIDKTVRRAIPERDMAIIASLRIRGRSLSFSRDLFLFSYATCGMTFVDMAYLRKSDIQGGVLTYNRRKTGTKIQVRLEPTARVIIDKYLSLDADSPYVFPILGKRTGRDAYRRFTSALTEYNRALKKLSAMAGTARRLSSYVSRHSWATAARNNGADISTVSEALGHMSERTTRIYLASFDRCRIEKVNKKLVDRLNLSGYL